MIRTAKRQARFSKRERLDIEKSIKTMLIDNKIQVSQAKTAREICLTSNYNRAIESSPSDNMKLKHSLY